jgi:tetratricopeptide (TPR) repeat protein
VRLLPLIFLLALIQPQTLLAQEDEEKSPLEQRTGNLLGRSQDERTPEEALVYQQEILALADTLEGAEELVLATHCLERAGILSYQRNDFVDAIEIWERGLELARRSEDSKRIGALLNAQAIGVSATGDNVRAIELNREIIEFRRSIGDRRGEGVSLSNLAISQITLDTKGSEIWNAWR